MKHHWRCYRIDVRLELHWVQCEGEVFWYANPFPTLLVFCLN